MSFTYHFRIVCIPLLVLLGFNDLNAQNPVSHTPHDDRGTAEQRAQLRESSLVAHLPFKNIGPTVFSGRVTALSINPNDPNHFYVAYASGGLWETKNNGTSFTPIFDNESTMTIGAIAVNWENQILYIGSGEVNSSRSSYAGNGIYKSHDNGKNWTNIGLMESHHIGKIEINPSNPDIINVAVLGRLYSPNTERGIYHSSDGGTSWERTLFVNENAGAVDLITDPSNTDVMYTSIWQRERRAWNFVESGEGSAIYKSMDKGKSWNICSTNESGFPTGKGVGRIGLSISKDTSNSVIYALLDNYDRRPKEEKSSNKLKKDDFKEMSLADFKAIEEEKLEDFLRSNRFPDKYSAASVKTQVTNGEIEIKSIAEYLEDANRLLFDTPVIGAELYKSTDDGATWEKIHTGYLDHVYNSYGYYFGLVKSVIDNPNIVYIAGVPILKSTDGGVNFENVNGENVHVDHHALWINPNNSNHLINGNDGGVNISYDGGDNWIKNNSPSVGQFYAINVDMAEPYNVYGGLQDNGVWVGSHNYEESTRWHSSGHYPYTSIMGGDGMQIEIDARDNNTVYTGYQFGNYFRINKTTKKNKYISPKHELGERPYRWNWQSPILLSSHNQDILYLGAHKLFRSFDQGNNFEAISDDLTNGGKKGDVAFGTLTTIDESDLQFGLLYTGSDDGLIHVSKDGGVNWSLISSELPQHMWVSRIQASKHVKSRVYASLNAYRWDNFEDYLYVSEDYGSTWSKIGLNLPNEPINVVKEDPVNADIIYVGTDHGVYVSIDKGQNFMAFTADLPSVAVHDLVVHPRDKDLVVGTHGRSIYIADVAPLQVLHTVKDKEIHVFDDIKGRYHDNWGNKRNSYTDARIPKRNITVYAQSKGKASLRIDDENGKELYKEQIDLEKGISQINYDMRISEKGIKQLIRSNKENKPKLEKRDTGHAYLVPGNYKLSIEKNKQKSMINIEIKE